VGAFVDLQHGPVFVVTMGKQIFTFCFLQLPLDDCAARLRLVGFSLRRLGFTELKKFAPF